MGRHNVGRIVEAIAASDGIRARLRATTAARQAWPTVFEGLVRFHPAALLILRNTRGALERIGYSFPERTFDSIEPVSPHQVLTLLRAVERYLSEALGTVERSMWSDRSNSVGFLTVTYQQRIASSLQSAFDTLRRRSDRLVSLLAGEAWSDEETDDDEDESVDTWSDEDTERPTDAVRRACEVELSYIRPILKMFEQFEPTPRAIDPKMIEAMAQLRSGLDAGHSCLVFSKYTSTVRSLIESFRDAFGTMVPFATYTGGFVEVFDGTTRRRASKKDVTDALDAGAVGVVFCSDAASEGLNLQAASVLINVDVPWNPAKLEQRIGRIARVGQKEPTVRIVNLWYPGSIEREIYGRLLARKELLDLAVGTYPELVSQAIRAAVSERSLGAGRPTSDLLAELQEARKSTQLKALSRVWNRAPVERLGWQGTSDFRSRLLRVLERTAARAGWVVARVDGATRFASKGTTVAVSADVDARTGFTLAAQWIFSSPRIAATGKLS